MIATLTLKMRLKSIAEAIWEIKNGEYSTPREESITPEADKTANSITKTPDSNRLRDFKSIHIKAFKKKTAWISTTPKMINFTTIKLSKISKSLKKVEIAKCMIKMIVDNKQDQKDKDRGKTEQARRYRNKIFDTTRTLLTAFIRKVPANNNFEISKPKKVESKEPKVTSAKEKKTERRRKVMELYIYRLKHGKKNWSNNNENMLNNIRPY